MPKYSAAHKIVLNGSLLGSPLKNPITIETGEILDYDAINQELHFKGVVCQADLTTLITNADLTLVGPGGLFDSNSDAITYNPTNLTDWSPVPTNLTEALDQLAGVNTTQSTDITQLQTDVVTAQTDATQALTDAATANSNADTRVLKAGDTMIGALVLPSDPVNPLEAATKQYVDTANSTQDTAITAAQTDATQALADASAANTNANSRVLKSGDTMTGILTLSADPTNSLEAATKQYVDAVGNSKQPLSAGLFASKPLTPGLGQMYFATDRGANGLPIWWNGTDWIDAASNIVI